MLDSRKLIYVCIVMASCLSVGSESAEKEHMHHGPRSGGETSYRPYHVEFRSKSEVEVVHLLRGEEVRLLFTGDDNVVYHLHGYNVIAIQIDDQQYAIDLHAEHSGRFPLVAHKIDELSGMREETIAYIEVRVR